MSTRSVFCSFVDWSELLAPRQHICAKIYKILRNKTRKILCLKKVKFYRNDCLCALSSAALWRTKVRRTSYSRKRHRSLFLLGNLPTFQSFEKLIEFVYVLALFTRSLSTRRRKRRNSRISDCRHPEREQTCEKTEMLLLLSSQRQFGMLRSDVF